MRVLVVEDSNHLRRVIGAALKRIGFAVDLADNGENGLLLAEDNEYDVIILDIMLPRLDGLSILAKLRAKGKMSHVLLLTAKDTVDDRIAGLRLGADDYVVKPFALGELIARVEALCRRAYGQKQPKMKLGDLEIDRAARRVYRLGQPIDLTPREYALLEYLANRPGQVVSRSEIEAHIYHEELDPMSNVIDSTICDLRRKITPKNSVQIIYTRRGLGYELSETMLASTAQ